MSANNLSINISNHNHQRTSNTIRDVVLDPGDDEILDPDYFEDSRIEQLNSGHNLTSVLMNPRESLLEDIFDEFATDQSIPLDHSSSGQSSNSPSRWGSSHSNVSLSSHHSSTNGMTSQIPLFTATEDREIQDMIRRFSKIFQEYQQVRQPQSPEHAARKNEGSNELRISAGVYIPPNRCVEEMVQCFTDVPDIFFKSEFSLIVPEIFYQALGIIHKQLSQHQIPNQLIANHQDKLSRYLDLVEVALLKQIWSRSPAFFRVLGDIRGLQFLVSQASIHLVDLRENLQTVNESVAMSVLRISKMYRRQRNETALQAKLDHIKQVMEGRDTIQTLLEVEDYIGALEVVAECKRIYYAQLIDIVSLRRVGEQLDEYDMLVGEIMCNKFVSLAIQWDDDESNCIRTGVQCGAAGVVGGGGSSSSLSDAQDYAGDFDVGADTRDSLAQLMHALMTVDRIKPALNMYKSRLSESLRLIIRTCVLEYLTSVDPSLLMGDFLSPEVQSSSGNNAQQQESPTLFGQRVLAMSSENFLSCLSMCFEHVLIALSRAHGVHQFIEKQFLAVLEESLSCGDRTECNLQSSTNVVTVLSPVANEVLCRELIETSASCLSCVCELSHCSINQLLTLRKDSNTKLSVDKTKFLWESCTAFVTSLEKIMGTSAYTMRHGLVDQAKAFLHSLHEGFKGKLVNALDNERWGQCDVTPDRQINIDKLVSGRFIVAGNKTTPHATASAATPVASSSTGAVTVVHGRAVVASSSAAVTSATVSTGGGGGGGGAGGKGSAKKELRAVIVDGHSGGFNVVWSVLLLVEEALTYLDIAVSFPDVASDIVDKLVELIKLFDSRTRQLVLGAQAIQSAGRLKSISAKHLAITGQSLSLVVCLMPHFRVALLAQLPVKSHNVKLVELDRAAHDLVDHHGQIVSKFVAILGDNVDSSAVKLRQIDWDRGFQGQCQYFEEVTRNVSALHRVLMEALPPEQIQDVMSRIFALLNRKLPGHFDEIMPATPTGRQRILDEVTHLVDQFSRMGLKQLDLSTPLASLEEAFRRRYGASNTTSNNNNGKNHNNNNNSNGNGKLR